MGRIDGSVSQRADRYSFYIDWSESDVDTANNTSVVSATVYAHCSSGNSSWNAMRPDFHQSLIIDGTEFTNDISAFSFSAGVTVALVSGSKIITHTDNGSKSIPISAECDLNDSNGAGPAWGSASGTATLTTIPRYFSSTPTMTVTGKTTSSVTIRFTASEKISRTQYSINSISGWVDVHSDLNSTSGSYTITGLSPNTSYTIYGDFMRRDSGLWCQTKPYTTVTTYARTIPTISLSSKTVNSITVTSGCNVTASSTQYRIKKSNGSYGSYQTSATFTGLTPNTDYVIEVKKVGNASGESGTATLAVTTYNNATLNAISNFNLGDSKSITYSNPSGQSISLGIYKDSQTAYIGYKTVTGSSYTYNFTDSELDILYKAMGTKNSLKVRFYLTTICNGSYYYDYKEVTINLTGSQKTGHVNVNGNWKRTKRWVNVNGNWKRCVRWINVDGVWKRCI